MMLSSVYYLNQPIAYTVKMKVWNLMNLILKDNKDYFD